MEANICDINHLDADVLLPPRKRLLAGLKKQNSDGRSYLASTSIASSQFDSQLNNRLKYYSNSSPEETIEASRVAAEAAAKVAKAARASAEEKAVVAAKAMAAAKTALDLVAMFSEETAGREKSLKNKMKRHLPVQILYDKKQKVNTDEEVARNLHRAINSSPRINKNSSSDMKGHRHKKLVKSSSPSEKLKVYYGGTMQDISHPSTSNGSSLNAEGSTQRQYLVRFDESTLKLNTADLLRTENQKLIASYSKGKTGEALEEPFSNGRKRGRIKQKKLPLSICSYRDQASPKEELKYRSLSFTEENASKDTAGNKALLSVEPSGSSLMPIEGTTTWKCKVFKSPACVKQNKVLQS